MTVSFVSSSRSSVFLVVNCVSGTIWKIPIDLIATEALVDNVLIIEATEVGKTSAVSFRLTSNNRCVCVCYYFLIISFGQNKKRGGGEVSRIFFKT